MNNFFDIVKSINLEIDGIIVKDVAEKIGSLFGEEGRKIGKVIDDVTKEVTVKLPNDKND